jgi:hypothetical protein
VASRDDPVSAAVIGAYYSRSVGAGDLARGRAQAAQAACGGFGVVVLAYLSATPDPPQGPALVAFAVSTVAWATASILFALAAGANRRESRDAATSESDFVAAVIAGVRTDQAHVARWQRAAVVSSCFGWGAVIVGVLLTVTHDDSTRSAFVMRPTAGQAALLRSACGWTGHEVHGTVSAESVSRSRPELVVSPDICAGRRISFSPTPDQWADTLVDGK